MEIQHEASSFNGRGVVDDGAFSGFRGDLAGGQSCSRDDGCDTGSNQPAPPAGMPAAGTRTGRSAAMDSADASGMFASIPAWENLSSKVVGLNVYNNSNQDIGKIRDIAFDASGVKAHIVAVGGVLGVGDHQVAVNPPAIAINHDANAKQWHAAMDTNADQPESAPKYKYSSNEQSERQFPPGPAPRQTR